MQNDSSRFIRMKLDKKFVAAKIDKDDEIFPNGIFKFNITKMLEFIRSKPDKFVVEQVLLTELGSSSNYTDETTVDTADLNSPIILAEISPGRFNVIDGNHRVERARRVLAAKIPAYRLQPEFHYRFLTCEKAYKEYVGYWNLKVKELEKFQKCRTSSQ
ncbi:MAG: ParB/Srx family N-terminal domain-containing protein [Proteobacteria bacterium]|nr:ParB/Srx family N-terminal domain-containing protein [Pseudomonadota bacterium]